MENNRKVLDLTAVYDNAMKNYIKRLVLSAASVENVPTLKVSQIMYSVLEDKHFIHGTAKPTTVFSKVLNVTRQQIEDSLNKKHLDEHSDIFSICSSETLGGETIDISEQYEIRQDDANACVLAFNTVIGNLLRDDIDMKDFKFLRGEDGYLIHIPENHEGADGQLALRKISRKRIQKKKKMSAREFCRSYKIQNIEAMWKWWHSEVKDGNRQRLVEKSQFHSFDDIYKILSKKRVSKKQKVDMERICWIKNRL